MQEYLTAAQDGNGVVQNGESSLINPANGQILAGSPGEAYREVGAYPLTRNFDHRVQVDLDSGGMPIPSVVYWTTDNKHSVRHTMGTFPISYKWQTRFHLNASNVVSIDNYDFRVEMLHDTIVFRRAEDKISERFEILNPRYFQTIRLAAFIERRHWNTDTEEYVFQRTKLKMRDGDFWTAKLRFRTI